ncbi:SLAP domain-containing protein [Companilactobacillus hulinensis]|uniref:SLAP domain-containing protein n=1 Tax=Companilactobacillus hulinensis TaxID=2486007 RepID=UPI000F7B5441|nr:SLAP domain-containing protein [Companilactobacillus hulinensis]
MKKRSLTISTILFSSILLGMIVSNPSEVYSDVKNTNSKELENNEIENEVVFLSKDGNMVDTIKITGKVNSIVELTKLELPAGYRLAPDNKKFKITKNGKHIVVISAMKIKNVIKFVEYGNEKFISKSQIEGYTDESYDLSSRLPKGYNFSPFWERTFTISATEMEQKVTLSKIITNKNKVQFIDSSNVVIEEKDFLGDVGDTYNLYSDIPDNYEAIEGQSLTIHFKEGYITHVIKVKKTISEPEVPEIPEVPEVPQEPEKPKVVTNIFEFKDYYNEGIKSIATYKATGKDGDKVAFPKKILPNNYELKNDEKYEIDEQLNTRVVWVRKIITNNVEFVNYSGEVVGKESFKGGEGVDKKLTAPKGYKFINGTDHVTLSSKNMNKTILVVPEKEKETQVTIKIEFIDNKTNKKITTGSISGKENTKQKVLIPIGYKVSKGYSEYVNMDKNTPLLTIKLDAELGVNEQHYSTNVLTHANKQVSLYNIKGQMIEDRALAGNSVWHVDRKMVLNGQTFYRVATNEWIKREKVLEYVHSKGIINTKNGSFKKLYNSKGVRSTTRALASNSSWATDKTATINGQKMYRVATDEWVSSSDIK